MARTFGAGTGRQATEPTRDCMLRLLVRRRVHLQVIDAREVSGHHSSGIHGGDVAQQRHGDDEENQNNTQFPEIHFKSLWVAVESGMKISCSTICLREVKGETKGRCLMICLRENEVKRTEQ